MKKFFITLILIVLISIGYLTQKPTTDRLPKLKLASSIYVGWMPWFLASEDGTISKIGKKHHLEIEFVRGDYANTLNQFLSGEVDAVTVTNIDAFLILAAGKAAADVVIIGSISNGNDVILARPDAISIASTDRVGLVENSVSHYLLFRYWQQLDSGERFPQILNISDSQIGPAFASTTSNLDAVVTWNPIAMQLRENLRAKSIFSSADIPDEIVDLVIVKRSSLTKFPSFSIALKEIWTEMMGRFASHQQKNETIKQLAWLSGTDADGYLKQMKATRFISTSQEMMSFVSDENMLSTMKKVEEYVVSIGRLSAADSEAVVSYDKQKRRHLHFGNFK